jgi:hypothetical protein
MSLRRGTRRFLQGALRQGERSALVARFISEAQRIANAQ